MLRNGSITSKLSAVVLINCILDRSMRRRYQLSFLIRGSSPGTPYTLIDKLTIRADNDQDAIAIAPTIDSGSFTRCDLACLHDDKNNLLWTLKA